MVGPQVSGALISAQVVDVEREKKNSVISCLKKDNEGCQGWPWGRR